MRIFVDKTVILSFRIIRNCLMNKDKTIPDNVFNYIFNSLRFHYEQFYDFHLLLAIRHRLPKADENTF